MGGERDHHCATLAPQWSRCLCHGFLSMGLRVNSLVYAHKLPLPWSVHTPSEHRRNRTLSEILIHSLKHEGVERGLARDQNIFFWRALREKLPEQQQQKK